MFFLIDYLKKTFEPLPISPQNQAGSYGVRFWNKTRKRRSSVAQTQITLKRFSVIR